MLRRLPPCLLEQGENLSLSASVGLLVQCSVAGARKVYPRLEKSAIFGLCGPIHRIPPIWTRRNRVPGRGKPTHGWGKHSVRLYAGRIRRGRAPAPPAPKGERSEGRCGYAEEENSHRHSPDDAGGQTAAPGACAGCWHDSHAVPDYLRSGSGDRSSGGPRRSSLGAESPRP